MINLQWAPSITGIYFLSAANFGRLMWVFVSDGKGEMEWTAFVHAYSVSTCHRRWLKNLRLVRWWEWSLEDHQDLERPFSWYLEERVLLCLDMSGRSRSKSGGEYGPFWTRIWAALILGFFVAKMIRHVFVWGSIGEKRTYLQQRHPFSCSISSTSWLHTGSQKTSLTVE